MRRVVFVAALVLAACGKSPSAPSSSPPPAPTAFADFSGYWSGTFAYKACIGLHCSGKIDRDDHFSLRLRQTLNRVTGVFASEYGGSVEISGDVRPDGSLVLSGSEETGGTTGVRGSATFSAPSIRLDAATGLSGGMRLERTTLLSAQDRFVAIADGAIVSATRQSLDAFLVDLSGKWRGMYLVRECVEEATGRPLCDPFQNGQVEYLELSVAIGASEATGELTPISMPIPVRGSVRGRTIELTGVREDPNQQVVQRVTGLSASVDDFGRLKGAFTYARVYKGVTSTARVELLHVTKFP